MRRGASIVLAALAGAGVVGALCARDSRRGSSARDGAGVATERRAAGGAFSLPAGFVPGHVVGLVMRDGTPVAARIEARLFAEIDGPDPVRRTVTDVGAIVRPPGGTGARRLVARSGSDGRFTADLLPAQWWLVALPDDGRGFGGALVDVRSAGARVGARLEVAWGPETLRGRALRADGTPWRGVVLVEPAARAEAESPVLLADPAATDDQGRFSVSGLPATDVRLTPIEPDVLRARATWVHLPSPDEVAIVVDAGFAPTTGRVVDADGRPVSDAEVVLRRRRASDGASEVGVRTTTGADGAFRAATPDAPGEVEVVAAGFRRGRATLPRGGREVVVRLARPARILGRVTSEDGAPVVGVPVIAASRPEGEARWGRSAEDGAFAIEDVPTGDVLVFALGGGWASRGLAEVRDAGSDPSVVAVVAGSTSRVDPVVVRTPRVECVVSDAGGRPAVGAAVRATAGPRGLALFRIGRLLGHAERVAGEDGTAVFDTLLAGMDYELEASLPGAGSAVAKLAVPRPDETLPLRIELPPPRRVKVIVEQSGSGDPAGGVTVTVHRRLPSEWGREPWSPALVSGVSDAEGRVHIEGLPAGRLAIGAPTTSAARRTASPERRELPGSGDGASEMTARVEVPPLAAASGRVFLPDGGPAVGALVVADAARAVTDAQGAFVLPRVPSGSLRIVATLERPDATLEGTARASSGDTAANVRLAPAPPLRPSEAPGLGDTRAAPLILRLVGDDGKPVASARARVFTEQTSTLLSFSEGSMLLSRVPPGARLDVWSPRGPDEEPLPWGSVTVSLRDAQEELVVRMPAEWRIVGRVVGPDRRGVEGVEVAAVPDTPGRFPPPPHDTTRSGPDGAFALRGLADRLYRLEITPDLHVPAGDDAPRASGGTGNVEVPVRTGALATVRVVDWKGVPVSRARILVFPDRAPGVDPERRLRGLRVDEETDALGVAHLRGLVPGVNHHLSIAPPAGREEVLRKDVGTWVPEDTRFELDRGYALSGVVVDAKGAPVPGARIRGRPDRRGASATVADEVGAFRITGLPAGPVTLRVEARGPSSSAAGVEGRPTSTRTDPSRDLTVQAGDENVVLRGETGPLLALQVEAEPGAAALVATTDLLVDVTREDDGATLAARERHAMGVVRVEGLDPTATYAVWIRSLAGHGVHLRGARTTDGVLTVRLRPERVITGHVRSPPGTRVLLVTASGVGFRSVGVLEKDGAFRIEHVPEGTWSVEVRALRDGESRQASADVAAGGDVDLTIPEK